MFSYVNVIYIMSTYFTLYYITLLAHYINLVKYNQIDINKILSKFCNKYTTCIGIRIIEI